MTKYIKQFYESSVDDLMANEKIDEVLPWTRMPFGQTMYAVESPQR
jgi:hypothetical protein